jgi:hypothetical protein
MSPERNKRLKSYAGIVFRLLRKKKKEYSGGRASGIFMKRRSPP